MTLLRMAVLALASVSVAGCADLLVGPSDSQCARDLEMVEHTARTANNELDQGQTAEQRQPGLARMVDAAGRARASCGYQAPDPDPAGSRRARQPKAG